VDAVVACTPVTSLFAGLGLAGGGYLVGREGVAACGAVVSVVGLMAERMQARNVRVKLRRERSRHRGDLRQVSRDLRELQRELAALRCDLDGVRGERDTIRGELVAAVDQLSAARVAAPEPVEPAVSEPVVSEPVVSEPAVGSAPAISLLVPGQVRSPIATGGLLVLRPGPSEPITGPVPVLSLVPAPSEPSSDVRPVELVDAMVYAALEDAEADELTRALELPGQRSGRHAGALHLGDAHHAGDYARADLDLVESDSGVLYVIRRGRHVA
jgi:hypothetical protein